MSNWTLKELEAQLSKLEDEIAIREEAADEFRHEISRLTPRVPFDPCMVQFIEITMAQTNHLLLEIDNNFEDNFRLEGEKIGTALRIRYPNEFLVSEGK